MMFVVFWCLHGGAPPPPPPPTHLNANCTDTHNLDQNLIWDLIARLPPEDSLD